MELGVESLIYLYIAICVALIGFNFACIFVFRAKDRRLKKETNELLQMVYTFDPETFAAADSGLMAVERAVNNMKETAPAAAALFCEKIKPKLYRVITEKGTKDPLIMAYVLFLSTEYGLFRLSTDRKLKAALLRHVENEDFYLRENALNLIYNIGDSRLLADALFVLDRNGIYHNEKLLHDGMLEFTGNKEELWEILWDNYDSFSTRIRSMLLKYFRFATDGFGGRMLEILSDDKECREIHESCIRYLGRYPYEPAREVLYRLARAGKWHVWEYTAAVAAALAVYPGPETEKILKELLSDRHWEVRVNAAEAFLSLGAEYQEYEEILDGDDRNAAEALRYCLDRQALMKGGMAS